MAIEILIEELMGNAGIIRNRLKINAVITNARLYYEVLRISGISERVIIMLDAMLIITTPCI